jgi:hypothetical protein
MKLTLNSVPASVLTGSDDREKLVALGRVLMMEANGRAYNKIRKNQAYTERMTADKYAEVNEGTRSKIMLFCAARADAIEGREAPADYKAFLSRSRDYYKNPTFLRTLSGIVQDIIQPMLPYVTSNALDELAQMVNVPFGQTYEITVGSNDIFMFQDSSWGASRSVPENVLYDRPITLNPSPRSCSATAKWYQLTANDADFGKWLNAIYAGLYSKIMAMWNSAMTAAASNTFFVPSYLTFGSFTSANFNNAVELISAVNHVPVSGLIAYGRRPVLAKALPTSTAQDAALTYMLGREWMDNGYMGTIQGVRSFAIENAMVPGTQNTTGGLVISDSKIYVAAARGNGYAPIYIGFEDGAPIVIEMEPRETADMTLNVNVTASLDVKAVFGTKIAVITAA